MKPRFPGVAFFGHKHSGKSTLASMVEWELWDLGGRNTVRLAFAGALKDLCRELIASSFRPLSDEELKKAEVIRLSPVAVERLNTFLVAAGLPELDEGERAELEHRVSGKVPATWRWLMQWVGTDVVRRRDPNFWVEHLEEQALAAMDGDHFVLIEDGRMENELALCEKLEFLTVGVACPVQFDGDDHESEKQALKTAGKCRVFYSLPKSMDVLKETAHEIVWKFLVNAL
ncbi:hypothetical protein [Thermosulfurimonas sp. F29]|uniref:deoxynucleotide monophosphate kinase family protein n=1 Tax=Thermosulfurimonas sp. F29 TaxID=2867247 RepID=UPI001C834FB1|nr:hypothetical protein [Thermosulfurimonas sp. F29]MBX6424143.1 hypothetical protein [Thermosulfurimonas sp. F29]